MIRISKETDERREAGPLECWCLHGAVGMASDWRDLASRFAKSGISTRAVDLWRFLEEGPFSLTDFGKALNADAGADVFRGTGRALLGYSMGGRLALHALLEKNHLWQSAVIVSAHPGLETETECAARRAADGSWATRSLTESWASFLTAWNAQEIFKCSDVRIEDVGKMPTLLERRDPAASAQLATRRREIAQSFVNWSLAAQESLWERLGEISIPVLWVAGENDAKFLELAQRVVPLMPKAYLAIAPGSGHRVPWESPEWFAQAVTHFLRTGGSP